MTLMTKVLNKSQQAVFLKIIGDFKTMTEAKLPETLGKLATILSLK